MMLTMRGTSKVIKTHLKIRPFRKVGLMMTRPLNPVRKASRQGAKTVQRMTTTEKELSDL